MGNKSKLLVIFLACVLFLQLGLTQSSYSQSDDIAADKKKVIILYKGDDVKEEQVIYLKKMGGNIKSVYTIIPGIAATVDEDLMKHLEQNEDIEGVYEDSFVHATLSDSIPQIIADKVHAAGFTGKGVNVCIVDTGVDDSHPALNPLIAEKDFVNDDSDATDDNFHGTHVAGIVASTDSVNKGVAFDSSLMAAKVLDQFGFGFTSDVILGIQWCASHRADIISMSLGGGLFSNNCDAGTTGLHVLAQASNKAVDRGIVVVASAGNNFASNSLKSPACASKVIAVGAIDDNDGEVSFSNTGTELDMVAPGINIVSLKLGGGFRTLSGTSMATPHVAGVIALLLEKNHSLNPTDIRSILRDTALDLGNSGFDSIFGFGRVDAFAAFEEVLTPRENSCDALEKENPAESKGKAQGKQRAKDNNNCN